MSQGASQEPEATLSQPFAERGAFEKAVQRNPHPEFKKVEASRPGWREDVEFNYTKTKSPEWKPGQGGNDNGESLNKEHIQIDPYEEGRPAVYNYKLLISGIIPRPIGFISTCSGDGRSTNLAPMSYFQVVNHDPPVFTVGFSGGLENAKDSLRNLTETKECVINIISEHFIEAANFTSITAPYGVSEWALTGLHPEPCSTVKASRVKESIFSVEGMLVQTHEFSSRADPGKKTGVLAIIEGTRFWVREDAINKEKNIIDPAVLRPMSRLGGIGYGRLVEGIEIPRPEWKEFLVSEDFQKLIQPKADGQ
ncbi:hypothetical protein L228DRAFT_244984 [Xylona heveae TC161]|uniref:Flavin reductase like domain-containing protein n=1 Tax=Xylona heveae (strain CBS 132557 / TC161) TaxID=1328760 RepID=A0A165HYP0_XYLHT|nr:hypothetical protein L228DRAFT_244984 [Xylona heveae TC161]KZF24105.1 hypothetical protein L228DRAFT_244984 [Xylona heveae TC161]